MELHKAESSHTKTERRMYFILVFIIGLLILPSPLYIKTLLIQAGYTARFETGSDKAVQLLSDIAQAPIRYMTSQSDMPLLKVNIKYQNWLKIMNDREQALSTGRIPEIRNRVKGEVYYLGQKYKTEIRLQGDMLDHVNAPNKWFLRFEVKKKQAILSSRRFALVSANVRGHHGSMLFSQTMKGANFDIITPIMKPVKVIMNGEDWGVMLFEQAFSQDMLAVNNRTEGLITRFDLVNETQNSHKQIIRKLRPRVLQRSTILGKPALNKQRAIALSLLSDFINKKRTASDVFDHEKLGQYLATVDVWSAWHALTWNNWRFYYNPHTAKLEPIQSDVAVSPAEHFWFTQAVTQEFKVTRMMLNDKLVKNSYMKALKQIDKRLDNGSLQAHLNHQQTQLLTLLNSDMPLISTYDFDLLQKQTKCIIASCTISNKLNPQLHKQLSFVNIKKNWDLTSHFKSNPNDINSAILTIENNTEESLNLETLFGATHYSKMVYLDEINSDLPLTIPPNNKVTFKIPNNITSLDLHAGLESKKIKPFHFIKDTQPLDFIPRPISYNPLLKNYPFITHNSSNKTWYIAKGDWQINDYLVTPNNWQVIIAAGANLRFSKGAGMMVFGKLMLNGSAQNSINLSAQKNQYWAGISVFSDNQKIEINHSNFSHSKGPSKGFWQARGALYFVKADAHLNHVNISDNYSEDALNMINSQFKIKDLKITNAFSDGFDCDFCSGVIKQSDFHNIGIRSGGDAIDVSGSKLLISNVYFQQIRDKAISAGENSFIDVKSISINTSNFGLVSKDASEVYADDIEIENINHYALMTYSKKSIFGGAKLIARNLNCKKSHCIANIISELGSQLSLDGTTSKPEKINIQTLYNTVMKSDKSQ
ncbi:hypothetical protein [Pseudoalteromonas denitrificans]|uniref:CotH protein n=1 Tax=Pseudoalteromonas denitrificans DSM 6059 TaxID=1123010 RepID=A0A1I1EVC2_9GAMM|nr:hypothetical protein [Pseudoalteromonas denitrificans]SFB88880.1 hypothetical protein SAMN02745724_00374 [Pseudoalteromonas denitrificans DSM 6059]